MYENAYYESKIVKLVEYIFVTGKGEKLCHNRDIWNASFKKNNKGHIYCYGSITGT